MVKLTTMDEFDALVAEARRQARQSGMKRSDITKAIAAVRKRERDLFKRREKGKI